MCAMCLYADRFRLGWAHDAFLHVTCSCISHAYIPFFQYIWYYWCCLRLFWLSFLFLPLFLFTLVMFMAPKRKSIPTRNPLRSGASSSFDPSPSNVQFRDDDAFKAFSENFFRRGIHLERQVVLSNFTDTDLPSVIHGRGWGLLCDILVTCRIVLIRVLLQHARDWSFCISLLHSRSRYTHSCHIVASCGCASSP